MASDLGTAVYTEGVDATVPWHFGDPFREQRALVETAAVIDRSNRDVLVVPGDDRLAWLHTICSQHVADLTDGESAESLVLSPHGHVEQHWVVTEIDDTVWIDTEPGAAAEVLAYLQKMRFLKRVEPADRSAEWGVVSVGGPKTAEVLAAAGFPVPPPGRAERLSAGGFVRRATRATRTGTDGADLVVPRAGVRAALDALTGAGAEPAGMWAFEALRVQMRRPRLGFETDHRTIPHEVGWIGSAVHLNKGCYRGQETVARVQNLGRPPRRLVLLHLSGDSDALPAPGTPIESAGRTVGFVGTAVHHFELGPIALGLVKRSTDNAAPLTADGAPVAIDPGSE